MWIILEYKQFIVFNQLIITNHVLLPFNYGKNDEFLGVSILTIYAGRCYYEKESLIVSPNYNF